MKDDNTHNYTYKKVEIGKWVDSNQLDTGTNPDKHTNMINVCKYNYRLEIIKDLESIVYSDC